MKNLQLIKQRLWQCCLLVALALLAAPNANAWYFVVSTGDTWDLNGNLLTSRGIGGTVTNSSSASYYTTTFTFNSGTKYYFVFSENAGSWDNINSNRYGPENNEDVEYRIKSSNYGYYYGLTKGTNGAFYFTPTSETAGTYLVTFDLTGKTFKLQRLHSACYLLGIIDNAASWAANAGTTMTSNGDGTYTASNVALSASQSFSFATALASSSDEWKKLAYYRLAPVYSSGSFSLTDNNVGTAYPLVGYGNDHDYSITTSSSFTAGNYDITVDLTNLTWKVEKVEIPDDFYVLSSLTTWSKEYAKTQGYKMTYNEDTKEYTYEFTPTTTMDNYIRLIGWSKTANEWYSSLLNAPEASKKLTESYQQCYWSTSEQNWLLPVEAGYTYTITLAKKYTADGDNAVWGMKYSKAATESMFLVVNDELKVELSYDATEGYYYYNGYSLSANDKFYFTTSPANGTKYGYTKTVEEADYSSLMDMAEGDGVYTMAADGYFNIMMSTTDNKWAKLVSVQQIVIDHIQVYLEQTSNVKISDIGTAGDYYKKITYSADNQATIDWDNSTFGKDAAYFPCMGFGDGAFNAESNSYGVQYIGVTTTEDGKKWWHWTINNSIANIQFHRTNKEDYFSEELTKKAGNLYYTWENDNTLTDHTREYYAVDVEKLLGGEAVLDGHYYVYFINTVDWANVYCYGFNATGDMKDNSVLTWPGMLGEVVGLTEEGYEIWLFDFGEVDTYGYPVNIIFNNGGESKSTTKQQTGDLTFVNGGIYDYFGVISAAYTLNNIIRNIKTDQEVTISDQLLAVFSQIESVTYTVSDNDVVKEVAVLYCKDDGAFGEPSKQPDGTIDYMNDILGRNVKYDQSNWVRLVPSYTEAEQGKTETLADFKGYYIKANTITGFIHDKVNPEFRVSNVDNMTKGDQKDYTANVYIMPHFNDTIVFTYTDTKEAPAVYEGSRGYFNTDSIYKFYFVAPKPMEYATIQWAVYDGDNKFSAPAPGTKVAVSETSNKVTYANEYCLYGAVGANMVYCMNNKDYEYGILQAEAGTMYSDFNAIVAYIDNPVEDEAPRRIASTGNSASGTYNIKPLSLGTGTKEPTDVVETLDSATKTVTDVRYYNVAGVQSATPFEGVNIVVTTYSDGSNATTKILK